VKVKKFGTMATGEDFKQDIMRTFLDLEKLDVNLYRSKHLMPGMPSSRRVYGGQVIGQALVAASETVPSVFHPHSLHCYFIKAGDKDIPILYHVDRVRDGRSFCTRFVKAVQEGESIFTCQLSFHKEEEHSITHQHVMPNVPPPEECPDAADIFRSHLEDPDLSPERKAKLKERLNQIPSTFDMRPTNVDAFLRVKATEPYYCLWVKAKGPLGADVRLHHCAASFISDSTMIATALLPHAAAGFQMGMVLSLDHSIWFHRFKFAIDDWMLYETESTIAAASRAFINGRLWSQDGTLVLSTAQEGLIRSKV
jgi:acyl-CoA thioesterase 8